MTKGKNAPVKYPYPRTSLPHRAPPELQALIDQGPMIRAELSSGTSAWLVTGLSETREVLTDQRFRRNPAANADWIPRSIDVVVRDPLLGRAGPKSAELRRVIERTFTARRLEPLRPKIASIVDALLDNLISQSRPADLIGHFTLPLPARVIGEMLGIPSSDNAMLQSWSDVLISDWNGDREAVLAAYISISEHIAELIASKRTHPADDLITALVAARDGAGMPSDTDLAKIILGLLTVDGHGVTTNLMNMSLLTLLDNSSELDLLLRNLDLIPRAVDELIRFSQLGLGSLPARVATERSTIGGVTILAGDIVLPLVQAANRDPLVFHDPNRLDLTRELVPHLAFGAGSHYCPGAQLARMEVQEAFCGLLGRLPGLRLSISVEHLRYKEKVSPFYILKEFPIAW